ncbi:PTS lactose/cellobiose transporter subunit IIA [Jeotgalibaca porci]|jgi:PTS system cellobiose-specific IIA component|uniref:PTS lactose/cellobiose transporter subunit IIA n=1 Tax=Jeotgalibaca porci TaxID=1868793 RepID=A0A6G7WI34_9LACT|nr:PTS lactose/cellobiose transporter subunit IIA [Jeotgalibaca porci]NLB99464.1 PTS lactose/cellobiose transporter subunit IIA [Lactobacillales bacterium]QIK51923.1 PTS lactose/cellobiose transporter subunit IIA [Jeotgalibaca porci]
MSEPKNLEVIMQLIMHGGDAKGKAIEAIEAAKAGDFESANNKLKESEQALVEAHHSQTGLLTQEASGEAVEVSLLMIHGQDHLMTAIAFKDLAKEIIEVYKRMESK